MMGGDDDDGDAIAETQETWDTDLFRQERGDRKQRKRDLLHEIRNPSTLGMHESVDECGLEWLEARLPKHLKSKLEHPLCNVTNNKPNK